MNQVALTIDQSYLSTAKPLTIREGTTAIASNFLMIGGSWPYDNGHNLTGLTLPSTLRVIGCNAFGKESNKQVPTITTLELPEGLQYIGKEAFRNAVGGTSLTIPESVTEIGPYAFCGSTTLLRLTYNSTMRHDVTDFEGHGGIFSRCTALERVTIGPKVSCILPNMFDKCTGLLIVNSEERSKDATLNLGWGAFRGCSNLMRMSLPEGTYSIYCYAFSGCSSLQNFYLPSSVRYIGQYAFNGMSLPDDFDFPSNLRCLDSQALQGVSNLTTLTFPARLDYIGSGVFDAK